MKCQSALQNVKLIVNTNCLLQTWSLRLRPDVRSQDDGRGCVRGRGGGRRPHGHHYQRVQQGAGGQQRGDAETVHEPPDIASAVTNRCQLEYFLYIKSLTYQYEYFQPIKISGLAWIYPPG